MASVEGEMRTIKKRTTQIEKRMVQQPATKVSIWEHRTMEWAADGGAEKNATTNYQ
jgi:hypothetical protein